MPIDDGPPDIYQHGYPPARSLFDSFPHELRGGVTARGGGDYPRWSAHHPASTMLPGNTFHLSATGPDAAWFHVESSSDLVNWRPVCTNQVINGAIDFVDPDSSAADSRFYRAVPELNPAPF